MPWYGDGDDPQRLWPGVTIPFEAEWSLKRGRWETHEGKYYFDVETADRACDFFPVFLRHHIGEFAGRPFELLEYQRKLQTRPLFGWKKAADNLRRFQKLFGFIPKGSGKSPWASGTGLYLACADGEAAAEVYALASDRQQARTVHDNAKIMVEESPDLLEMAEVLKDSILFRASRSAYMVLSSDAASAHGKRPHGLIFDEFHASKNRDLFEALRKSMPKRRQPVLIIITHSGDDDEGICHEEYELAKKVLSGTLPDESCLPVIFEASSKDDWTDPAVWARVNPGHGITIRHEGIAQECAEAQAEPRKVNDFLRYHLNRWVNQATAWIPIDWWDRSDTPLPSDDVLAAAPCAVGIDMAQKIDLSSAVAVFRLPLAGEEAESAPQVEVVERDEETGDVLRRTLSLNYRIAVVPAFWLPEETLRERVKQDGVPYDIWRNEGLLRVTDGAVVDSEALVRYITRDLTRRFPLVKQAQIGYDPAFATEVSIRLASEGYQAVEVLQNYKHLSEACQVFEALVKAGRVLHGGHRLLRWNVENVAVKPDDAGRIRMKKPRQITKRIDGVVATVMALSRLMVQAPPTPVAEPSITVLRW